MPDSQNRWVSLRSGHLTAEVDPLGAQLSVLRDTAGRDLLWDGDPAVWTGRAPLLFPIVGALAAGRYRLGAQTYALPRHGFARGKKFALVESAPHSATFRLQADESTLQNYPYRFELDVCFTLEGPSLSLSTSVRNRGDGLMFASFGYHPAFRWPLPFGRARSSHFVEFSNDEPAPIRRLDSDGLLKPDALTTPVAGRRLLLDDSLFMASRWLAAGNRIEFALYPGALHGFNLLPHEQALPANQRTIEFLNRQLAASA